jgi:hypothetical protein
MHKYDKSARKEVSNLKAGPEVLKAAFDKYCKQGGQRADNLARLHVLRSKLETTMSSLKLMRMLFRGQPLQDEGGNVQMVKAKCKVSVLLYPRLLYLIDFAGIVDVFRVRAFRRIFLRFTQRALSQLQLPVLVRFSSYAIMLQSLLKYRSELVSAVATEEFLTAANKATKRNKAFQPPLEQVHEVLHVAEEELERDELHSFDDRRAPAELAGRWKGVYQAVMSEPFWDAAEV